MRLRLSSTAASSALLLAAVAALSATGGVPSASAWSLSSLVYGEDADASDADKAAAAAHSKRPKAKLPKILSRDLEASVSAASWPTTLASPLCEAWAFIDAGSGTGDDEGEKDGEKDGEKGEETERYERWKWSYLDALASGDSTSLDAALAAKGGSGSDDGLSYSDAVDLAVRSAGAASSDGTASGAFEASLESRLLRYDLALRAHSPLCELHRTLARDAALASGLYDAAVGGLGLPRAFAVSYPSGLVSADAAEIVAAHRASSHDGEENGESPLLPGERPRGKADNNAGDAVVVLYGQWGSSAFSDLYNSVIEADDVPVVVRFMGAIDHEERLAAGDDAAGAAGTVLQGYGVRLDIRNIEYKVFDDKADDDAAEEEEDDDDEEEEEEEVAKKEVEIDATADATEEGGDTPAPPTKAKPKKLRTEYLAGLNLTRLAERAPSSEDDSEEGDDDVIAPSALLSAIQSNLLLDSHHYSSHHAQTVPPAWQRRDLSLQAAAAISASIDPLATLQDVAQNLPSYASTLVELPVPDAIRAEALKLENAPIIIKNGGGEFGSRKGNAAQGQGSEGAFAFYVNGRKISVDRPSFNLFELMGVLREEDGLLGRMEGELGPHFATEEGKASGALGAVRDMIEMGGDALEKMGAASSSKDSTDDNAGGGEDDMYDDEDDDMDGEGGGGGASPSGKFRIDVGRGYRGAVLYVNDVEKDAQYQQWPRSVSQMMMMAQFGGPPTVRRNLFTVLIVLDPMDGDGGNGSGALDFILQLVQGNYPVRIGFLLVGQGDIDKCQQDLAGGAEECTPDPVRAEELLPASAHAVHLLLNSVMSAHGGMMGLSYMNFLQGYWSEHADQMGIGPAGKKSKMGQLMDAHAAFLERAAGSSASQGRRQAIEALTAGDGDSDSDDAVTYAKALKFATTKNVKPGMGFVNGVPLPSGGTGQDVQRVFMDEQQNVMGLIQGGKITDKGPRSIYAMLLTGSSVYPRMHPLLTETAGTYASPSHGHGEDTLLRPKDHGDDATSAGTAIAASGEEDEDVPAVFVVEAHLDLSTPRGLALAKTFLEVMNALPPTAGGERVSVSYRLVATELSDAAALVGTLEGVTDEAKSSMEAALTTATVGDAASTPDAALPSRNCLLANGRVLNLDDGQQTAVEASDIEILLTLEMARARAVSKMLRPHGASRDAVGRSAGFLGKLLGKTGAKRTDAEKQLRELGDDSPLHFEWNGDEGGVKVTAILDPLSEPTQRVAPLLRAVRDQLKLPLRLVVAPRTMIGADDSLPMTSYYRFVADPLALPDSDPPKASFRNLPTNHVLTIRMDVPEPWNVQQAKAVQDTDNLRCDAAAGCSDEEYAPVSPSLVGNDDEPSAETEKAKKKERSRIGLTKVDYGLSSLLFFGQCYDVTEGSPPNGLQLTMDQAQSSGLHLSGGRDATVSEVEINPDGSTTAAVDDKASIATAQRGFHSDTLVMKTVGYWQLRAKPGVFSLTIANNTRGSEIYQMVEGTVTGGGGIKIDKKSGAAETKKLVMRDFTNRGQILLVKKKEGFEDAELFLSEEEENAKAIAAPKGGDDEDDVIHVFSLATGHLYERFLKIMMLSVTKRTSSKVKFWFFENYLSPSFKSSATAMAARIGCEVAFVTYKWPEWLRGQSEKQRIIWGYKILFLDTLFPLDVKKIIYVDADQVVRGDLRELWDMDLEGAPYGYTPMCSSRESTLGFQFWSSGFWKTHLRDRPYHISALYVVDLQRFRRELVGDKLRQYYQQLSADPGSLANLDQDLPNYAQHDVTIFSLPQEWLWCESWCSDETKASAKTIDLCNNPLHKEPKVSMAKRIISGELFDESWVELDAEVQQYEDEYRASLIGGVASE